MQIEEETAKGARSSGSTGAKLNLVGFENIPCEELIREGIRSEEMMKTIAEDEDVSILRARGLRGSQGTWANGIHARGRRGGGFVPDPDHDGAGQSGVRRHHRVGLARPFALERPSRRASGLMKCPERRARQLCDADTYLLERF